MNKYEAQRGEAESAALSAARSAAWSAWSAARSAAWSAADEEEMLQWQIDKVLEVL